MTAMEHSFYWDAHQICTIDTRLRTCDGDNGIMCCKCSKPLAEQYALLVVSDSREVGEISSIESHVCDKVDDAFEDEREWAHSYCRVTSSEERRNKLMISIGGWIAT